MSLPSRANDILPTKIPLEDTEPYGARDVPIAPFFAELGADADCYAKLRYPGGAGIFRRASLWLRSPGLLVLAVHRVHQRFLAARGRDGWTPATIGLRMLLAVGWSLRVFIAKSDVAPGAVIARGVYLSDRGQLILGPNRIGSGTLIHDRVIIGMRAGSKDRPTIGENVWIGPDCVIYGGIKVGTGATVLPGTVLSMDVPADTVVGGNPATIVRENFDNSALRRTLAIDIDLDVIAPR